MTYYCFLHFLFLNGFNGILVVNLNFLEKMLTKDLIMIE